MFNLFKKTPEKRVEHAIISILTVITKDLDGFTERQQAIILKDATKRFVTLKKEKSQGLKSEITEIDKSLKLLK